MTDVKLWLLYSNTWNHQTVCKIWAQAHASMLSTKCLYKLYIYIHIYIYIYKQDLALNDLQWLMYHKTKPNFKTNQPTSPYLQRTGQEEIKAEFIRLCVIWWTENRLILNSTYFFRWQVSGGATCCCQRAGDAWRQHNVCLLIAREGLGRKSFLNLVSLTIKPAVKTKSFSRAGTQGEGLLTNEQTRLENLWTEILIPNRKKKKWALSLHIWEPIDKYLHFVRILEYDR